MNRAVDELYYMCEAEGSVEHCEEASKVLESCSRDFQKLIERSQVQSEYEAARRKHDTETLESLQDSEGGARRQHQRGFRCRRGWRRPTSV